MRDLTLRLVVDDTQKAKLSGFSAAVVRAQADLDRQFSASTLLRMETATNRLGQSVSRVTTVALTAMTFQVGLLTAATAKLGREFISVNEKFGGLQITLGSALKSLSAARQITGEIARLTATSPLPFQNIASVAQSFSVIPATNVRLLQDIQQNRIGSNQSFLKKALQTVEAMTTFRPDQDAESAIFAIREALGGQTRSLVRRFDIPSSSLSTASGQSMDKLKKNPEMMFDAINQFFTSIISPEAILQYSRQPSKLMDNMIEQIFEIPLLKLGSAKYRKMGEDLTEEMYVSPYETLLTRAKEYYEEVVTFMTTTFESEFLEPMRRSITSALSRTGDALRGALETILDRTGVPGQGTGIERLVTAGSMGIEKILNSMVSLIDFLTKPELITSLISLQEGLMSFGELLFKGFSFLSDIHPLLAPIAAIAAPYLLNNLGTILRAIGHDLPGALNRLATSVKTSTGIISPAAGEWAKMPRDFRARYEGIVPGSLSSSVMSQTTPLRSTTGAYMPSVATMAMKDYTAAFRGNALAMANAGTLLSQAGLTNPSDPTYQKGLSTIIARQRAIDAASFARGDRNITQAFIKNPEGMGFVGQGTGTLSYNGNSLDVNPQQSRLQRFGSMARGVGGMALTSLATGGAIVALTAALGFAATAITANSEAVAANTAAITSRNAEGLAQSFDPLTLKYGSLLGMSAEELRTKYQPDVTKDLTGLNSLREFLAKSAKDPNTGLIEGAETSWWKSRSTELTAAGMNPSNAKAILDAALEAGIIKKDTFDLAQSRMTEEVLRVGGGYAVKDTVATPQKALDVLVDALRGRSADALEAGLTEGVQRVTEGTRKTVFEALKARFGETGLELIQPFVTGLKSAKDPASVSGWVDELAGIDRSRQSISAIDAVTKSTLVVDAQQRLKAENDAADPLGETYESLLLLKRERDTLAGSLVGLDQAITSSFAEKARLLNELENVAKQTSDVEESKNLLASIAKIRASAMPRMVEASKRNMNAADYALESFDFIGEFGQNMFSKQAAVLKGQAASAMDRLQKAIPEVVNSAFISSIDATVRASLEGKTEVSGVNRDRINQMLASAGIGKRLGIIPELPEAGTVPETAMLDAQANLNAWIATAYQLLTDVGEAAKSDPGTKAGLTRLAAHLRDTRMAAYAKVSAEIEEFTSAYDPISGNMSRAATPAALRMAREGGVQGESNTIQARRSLMPDTYGGDERSTMLRQEKALLAVREKYNSLAYDFSATQESRNAASMRLLEVEEQINQLYIDREALAYRSSPSSFFDGLLDGMGVARNQLINFMELGRNVGNVLSASLGNAFGDIVTGTESVADAFRNMARDILNSVARMLANQAAAQLIAGLFSAFLPSMAGGANTTGFSSTNSATFGMNSSGTQFSGWSMSTGMATGGVVTGGSGYRDDVPTMLMGGEYVINKRAAMQIGYDKLDMWNKGDPYGMATGGMVPTQYASSPSSVDMSSGASPRNVTVNITINKDGSSTNEVAADDKADAELMAGLGRQIESMIDEKLMQQSRVGGTLNPNRR